MNLRVKNILVVNVNWLGDTVFATPVFKALKERYSGATLTCLCVPRVKEIVEMCPWVDHTIIYDEKGGDRGIFAKLSLIQTLRAKKFDAAFLLRPSFSRSLILYLAGIPVRVGLKSKTRGFLLSHPLSASTKELHRRDEYLHIIESFNVSVQDRLTSLMVPQENVNRMKTELAALGLNPHKFVVINAGGNWDLKRWPKEHFAQLIRRLMKDFKSPVLFVGAQKDREMVAQIVEASGMKPQILTGQTDLKDLAAIFSLAKLFICADTGPLHLANAVGCPAVALFGPTRPETTGPRGRGKVALLQKDVGCNRASCYHLTCQQNVCMQSISVDDVLQAYQLFKN